MSEPRRANLAHAIALAAKAHEGQRDKAGAPYVLHPLRVMFQLSTDEERIAAVLHDVVEDTPWTLDGLRAEGFSENVVNAVDALTRREDEDYEVFVRRAAENPLARRVKIADLRDNLDLSRIANPTERDRKRVEKYERALAILETPADAAGGQQPLV
jgi:(p)ppGpp synthase/HD superfamily hydrolase